MSRSQRVSARERNGSLTSEPDSMSHSGPGPPKTVKDRSLVNQSRSKKDKGPDTSTPVKSENQKPQDKKSRQKDHSSVQGDAVRRNLADELDGFHSSVNSSGSSTADAVHRVNQAAKALSAGPYSPALSSIQHDSTASTFGVSTGTHKRSFISEFENGTIQAQRHELQMLMNELKDRDRELNDMVKAHHNQLVGWEEDRQRILTLENRNSQLEAEVKRKNDQVHALVARLKTLESVEHAKQTSLEHTQSQLNSVTEQLSHTQLKLKETQEKSKQMGNMVKELSNTLSKLEGKEQEMLSLLKLKDKDLMAASSHLSELSSKLKSMDAKVKQVQRAEAEAQRDAAAWKEEYTECKKVIDRLKSDLNRSQLEEEESRLELDRAKREQERLSKQILILTEREKRQEELIASQRLKQERTDTELNSMRQLYERQQRDLSLLQLNLDSAKEQLSKQSEKCQGEDCNVSLLLQSPTTGRPLAYYTADKTVSLPKPGRSTFDSIITQPAPPIVNSSQSPSTAAAYSSGSADNSHHRSAFMSAVGTGHHQVKDTQQQNDQSNKPSPANKENSVSGGTAGEMTLVLQQPQEQSVRSGIPVMIKDKSGSQRSAIATRPSSVTPQYRGRSMDRSQAATRTEVTMTRTARSVSSERKTQDSYVSAGKRETQFYKNVQQPMLYPQEQSNERQQSPSLPQQQELQKHLDHQHQQQEEDVHSIQTQLKELQAYSMQVSHTRESQDSPAVGSDSQRTTTPPPSYVDHSLADVEFRTPPRRSPLVTDRRGRVMSQEGGSGAVEVGEIVDSVSEDYPEQTGLSGTKEDDAANTSWLLEGPEDSREWARASGSVDANSLTEQHTDLSMESPTSKLHRLLTESRQMVQSLERSTYPPFFNQEPLSPIKADVEEE